MKKLFIANWKMSMTAKEAQNFLRGFRNPKPGKADVVIAASFPHLPLVAQQAVASAQNVSAYEDGAYTGEVSAASLKEIGVEICLVGHSERRIYFGEDDKIIREKMIRLLDYKIHPVLCFGENFAQKKSGKTMQVIKKQLAILKGLPNLDAVILAYEPVWAISTFQTGKAKLKASDEDIRKIHSSIKMHLRKTLGSVADEIALLYGGSVNPENSKAFINFPEVDGALVGAASLQVENFQNIINNVA